MKTDIKTMNKTRRMRIWELLDYVGGQCLLLRDGSDELIRTSVRHDFIEHMIELRDKLAQVSEFVEETCKMEEI